MKKALLMTLAAIILCVLCASSEKSFGISHVEAAKKETITVEPRLLMAEVRNYGIIELKPEVTQDFYNILIDVLQKDFNVESRELVANLGGEPIDNPEIFSAIHMEAIVRGPFYNYDTSGTVLKNYANSALGRQNRGSKSDKKNDGKSYKLNTSLSSEVRKIGAAYGVDYLFFCNMRDIDAWRKVGSSNLTAKNLEGKKVEVNLDYYLIEVKTGKVFAGQVFDKNTKLEQSKIAKFYGQRYNVNDILDFALMDQALKIEKNILEKGLRALKS